MDKTHLKVRGHWMYRYRAVDRDGETLDFMPFESRDTAAAKQFFAEALANKGIPLQIVVDKTVPLAANLFSSQDQTSSLNCLRNQSTKISTSGRTDFLETGCIRKCASGCGSGLPANRTPEASPFSVLTSRENTRA